MFHKALTFPKRRHKQKKAKDLYGIWYTGTQLQSFSHNALRELSTLAKERSPKWRQRAKKNLRDWVSGATNADWQLLEAQDPAGALTNEHFRRFVEEDLLF